MISVILQAFTVTSKLELSQLENLIKDIIRIKRRRTVLLFDQTRTRQSCPVFRCPCPPRPDSNRVFFPNNDFIQVAYILYIMKFLVISFANFSDRVKRIMNNFQIKKMVPVLNYLLYKNDQSETVCFLRLFLCLCNTSFAIFTI